MTHCVIELGPPIRPFVDADQLAEAWEGLEEPAKRVRRESLR